MLFLHRDICRVHAISSNNVSTRFTDIVWILYCVFSGTRADTIYACLKYSPLWSQIKILPPLEQNMRLKRDNSSFGEILEKIGKGML